MRRALIAILLLAGVTGLVRRGVISSGDETVLFDAPRGAWLGTVRGDVPRTVVEQRDGWQRVRIEGWIAGSGASGFSGDGGPALAAAFQQPQGLAADSLGNVFIADTQKRHTSLRQRADL